MILLDLKTTQDASPRGFSRSVAEYGYHRQAAWYSNGYEQASGKEVAAFIFAAVTSAYPIIAAPYILDDESLAQGAEECAELLELYAQCRRTNTWPAFGDTPQLIGLPGWARRSMEVEISHV